MSKSIKIAALAVAIAAVVVLIYAVLTPEESTDTMDHNGMWGRASYSPSNVGLIAVSVIVIVAALMIATFWNRYEPLPPSMIPKEADSEKHAEPEPALELVRERVEEISPDAAASHNYLVLRLLTGDERTMYKALMDSGGEALQKDLILRTKMSNAKVSRVLDRLAEKDIITKERHGATNKVRIKLDR
jgi:uncharacterized membrane protein